MLKIKIYKTKKNQFSQLYSFYFINKVHSQWNLRRKKIMYKFSLLPTPVKSVWIAFADFRSKLFWIINQCLLFGGRDPYSRRNAWFFVFRSKVTPIIQNKLDFCVKNSTNSPSKLIFSPFFFILGRI